MAVVLPVFSDGTQGSILFGGAAGFVSSLFEWKYFSPKNSRSMNNYAMSPQSINNANNPYVTVRGGFDTANPPQQAAGNYNVNLGVMIVLFLSFYGTTHGYLGTFKVVEFNGAHSKQNGGDFDFTAEQQGPVTILPV